MVARLGVGATSASAIIFSILLASNFLVFAASQDRERLYSQSDAEDELSGNAIALMGAGGANVLLGAQSVLESGALSCSAAVATADYAIDRLSDAQRSSGLTVNVSAAAVPGGPISDNLSMLSPFTGAAPGGLNISLSMVSSGSDRMAGVSFGKSEVHLVHLPVRLQRLATDCAAAFGKILGSISVTARPNCTASAIAPLLKIASQVPAALAAQDGFSLGIDFTIMPGASCTIDLQVFVEQAGIPGPGGVFSVRMEESGSASFEQPASAPQA